MRSCTYLLTYLLTQLARAYKTGSNKRTVWIVLYCGIARFALLLHTTCSLSLTYRINYSYKSKRWYCYDQDAHLSVCPSKFGRPIIPKRTWFLHQKVRRLVLPSLGSSGNSKRVTLSKALNETAVSIGDFWRLSRRISETVQDKTKVIATDDALSIGCEIDDPGWPCELYYIIHVYFGKFEWR